MSLLIVPLVLLIGSSIVLAIRAATLPSIRTAQRLGEIEASYGFPVGLPQARAEDRGSLVDRLVRGAGQLVLSRMDDEQKRDAARLLTRGGYYRLTAETFYGYRVIATATLTALGFWILANGAGRGAVMMALFAPVLGWIGPRSVVKVRGDRRQERIDFDLPELIDLLVVTVEAGLGFSASLRNAVSRLQGPLKEELSYVLQEQRMGLDTHQSLLNFLERCDTASVRSFVRSVMQGEELGVSIGDIMRNLAHEMRADRQARAEEKAHKAPVKMLFPLVFLIFPAMLIVLLFPALYRFLQSFGG